jgi:predicted nuclease of predicted toxin-antitoxin system
LKLLFDENLAPSLVFALADIFPQSKHVARIGLDRVPDREVWEYAIDSARIELECRSC